MCIILLYNPIVQFPSRPFVPKLPMSFRTAVPCMLIRGGTSKGAYFLASDLPSSRQERDALLLSIMGSPHPDQIDGLGGGHPLRSKVAIVARSTEPGVDVDFLFAQVAVDKPLVDTSPNCGNILSGIGPFAIERGLVKGQEGTTTVRVRTLNTGTVAELVVSTPGGAVSYQGEARIDGVAGTSAPILVNFRNVAGSVCGALLPTGHTSDVIDGIRVTCIDNGMPVVVIPAASVGRTGYEGVAQLNADTDLKARLDALRKAAGSQMGLGDVSEAVIPKLSLIAPPRNGGSVSTRNFIPRTCHTAIGVFGAVSIATACVIPGSVAEGIAQVGPGNTQSLSVEHPTGEFTVNLELDRTGALPVVTRAGLLRTARLLFDGFAFPHSDYLTARPEMVEALPTPTP
jgi:4-oxalomesaconate tautomerase